jgi:hypothetical protein
MAVLEPHQVRFVFKPSQHNGLINETPCLFVHI